MSKDTVKLFQRARAALQSEKDSLSKALANAQATAADAEKRLAEIEAALGGAGTAPAKRRGRKPKKAAGKRRGRPAKKTAAKRGRPAKKKAAAKRKTVKKKAAKKAPRKAVKKAAKKAPKKAVKKAPKKAAKKAPAKKVKNKLSLKQVALAVTKGKALDAKQILGAAKKAGHKFSGKNPLNSLRVMLYTNKKAFKNNKGKFVAA
jgi:FtsZ-interacting cell division protein ZipA|tara:strand:+ start:283 stop:894 length:612 start_codon:yes stop_codon:yes gene_type:complete